MKSLILICLGVFAIASKANESFIIPIRENVGVYNTDNPKKTDKPIFVVGKSDRLQIIETGRKFYQIRDKNMQQGWIEKRASVFARTGTHFEFDAALIDKYIDNPEPVNIFGDSEQEQTGLLINRSFKDALLENVDKEIMERRSVL